MRIFEQVTHNFTRELVHHPEIAKYEFIVNYRGQPVSTLVSVDNYTDMQQAFEQLSALPGSYMPELS